jgi:hypothetical protein
VLLVSLLEKGAESTGPQQRTHLVAAGAVATASPWVNGQTNDRRGVYWTMTRMAGGERSNAAAIGVRCLAVDLDGAPLDPLLASAAPPTAVVESSPGRWHAYWGLEPASVPLGAFYGLQRALAERFGADTACTDLARVLRLPGATRWKGGTPSPVSVVHVADSGARSADALVDSLGLQLSSERPADGAASLVEPMPVAEVRDLLDRIPNDDRFADRAAWLPVVAGTHEALGGDLAGEELVADWTLRHPGMTKRHAAVARETYRTMKVNRAGGATRATLFALAAETARNADGFEDVEEPPEADAKDDAKPSRYRLSSVSELRNAPPLRWLIKSVLPAQGVAAIYGPSASGKSFLALDAAVAIASGEAWFDCRVVDQTPVVYLGLEGEAGIAQRVAALDEYRLGLLPDGLQFILRQSFALTDPKDVADLAQVLPKLSVLFVDTLNQAAPGADENSSQDMSQILAGAKALQRATGGLVVLVHHTGKDASRGLRGHSSLFAALDAAIEVEREGDVRRWRIAKAKDSTDDSVHSFRLVRVDLGTDADGDPLSSCIVESGALIPMAAPKLNPTERLALEALHRLCKGATDIPSASVPLAAWRDAFYHARPEANADSNQKAFRRAHLALVGVGLVVELEGARYAALDF